MNLQALVEYRKTKSFLEKQERAKKLSEEGLMTTLQEIQNQIADMGIVYRDLQEKVQQIFCDQEQNKDELANMKNQMSEINQDIKKMLQEIKKLR